MSTLTSTKSLTGSFGPEAFNDHLATLDSAPAWWLERKRAAFEKFANLGMPKRTDETWRFSNVVALNLDGFQANPPAPKAAELPAPFGVPHLAFINNTVQTKTAIAADLAKRGVIVTTLTEAAAKHAELLKAHFMVQ